MDSCQPPTHSSSSATPRKRRKQRRSTLTRKIVVKTPRPKKLLFPKKDTRVGTEYQADIRDVLPSFVRYNSSNYLTSPAKEVLLSEKDILKSLQTTRVEFCRSKPTGTIRPKPVTSKEQTLMRSHSLQIMNHSNIQAVTHVAHTPLTSHTSRISPAAMCSYSLSVVEVTAEAVTLLDSTQARRRKATTAYRFGRGYRRFFDDSPYIQYDWSLTSLCSSYQMNIQSPSCQGS